MEKILKLLYCDTNILIKYLLLKEKGSDIVQFLVKGENKLKYSYMLYTSQTSLYEIKKVLKRKVNAPKGNPDKITKAEYNCAIHRTRRTLSQVFKIIDDSPPPIRRNSFLKIMKEYKLKSRDARHWCTILDQLGHFRDVKIINSDRPFNSFVTKSGFKIVDPEKISIEDLKKILN